MNRVFLSILFCLISVNSYGNRLPLNAKGQSPNGSLIKLKELFYEGSWKSCSGLAPQVIRSQPLISDWILVTWLRCVRGQALQTEDFSDLSLFLKELKKVDVKKYSTSEPLIKMEFQNLIESILNIKKKGGVKLALDVLEELSSIWVTNASQRSAIYREFGRSFQEKHQLEEARWFFERAYKLSYDEESLALLNRVAEQLNQRPKSPVLEKLGYRSQDEVEMVKALEPLYISKDVLALAKEGIRYLKRFPLGFESEKVENRLHQVISDLGSDSKNLSSAQEKVLAILLHAPLLTLEKWCKKSHRKGDYAISLAFAEKALEQFETPDALWIAARSAFYLGKYSKAQDLFLKLIESYPKFSEIEDALFKISFSYIRMGKWSLAQSWLERMVLMNLNSSADLVSRYWLIRVKEKLGKQEAQVKEQKVELIKKYPLSYYGILLQSELNKKIELPIQTEVKIEGRTYPFTEVDNQIFKRLTLLSQNNWHDEAVMEWKSFDNAPYEDFLTRIAETFSHLGFYPGMTLILNDIDFLNSKGLKKEWLNQIYAKPYSEIILSNASKNGLDPVAIWSVIRQESLFLPLSRSPSQAFGLMQIISGTAKEISAVVKSPILDWSLDGLRPKLNIEFGAWYLKDLIKKFDNSFPMALAAYNYGPTRLKVWANLRELSVFETESSPQFSELWIDELPAFETQFYVKAILRNALIYKRLDQEDFKAETGFWKSLILQETL
jgi:soluble lytic murein transglycosylase